MKEPHAQPGGDKPGRKPLPWLRHVGNNIAIGMFLLAPVVLTGFIVHWLFLYLTDYLVPVPMRGSPYILLWRLAVLALVLFLLFLTGWLARYVLGRRLYRLSDRVLTRIPFINRVYVSMRQISEALFVQRRRLLREAVLVEYPRPGLMAVAFVTAEVPPRLAVVLEREPAQGPWVSLFVPTTPNPTSGILVLAPRSTVRPLPITVSEAMKFVVSAGMVLRGESGLEEASLIERIEAWLSRERGSSSPDGDRA